MALQTPETHVPETELPVSVYKEPPVGQGLVIISATFGGVTVKERMQMLCQPDGSMDIHMNLIVHWLAPDPLPGQKKHLAVLYHYEGSDSLWLLVGLEGCSDCIRVSREAAPRESIKLVGPNATFGSLHYHLGIKIVAVVYGGKRMTTPSVLRALVWFFSKVGTEDAAPIRTNDDFFKENPWPGVWKTWTIFARFGNSPTIHTMTGVEHGALELPWWK